MTKQELKNNYAKSVGYIDWLQLYKTSTKALLHFHMEEVMELLAKSVAQKALDKASENVFVDWSTQEIEKSSITNPNNIPL